MSVTSKDLPAKQDTSQAHPPVRQRGGRLARLALGLVLISFGIPFWFAGARYTLDGWIIFINWFLGWMAIPFSLERPDWRVYLTLMLAIGLIYSVVEVSQAPAWFKQLSWAIVAGLVGWLLVSGSDLGSTFVGVTNPAPNAWPLTRWVATHTLIAGLWTILLTFLPEWLIMWGLRFVFR